jgi:hypothetical protein
MTPAIEPISFMAQFGPIFANNSIAKRIIQCLKQQHNG